MGIIARQSIKGSIIGLLGVAVGAISRLFVATYFLSTEEIGLLDLITKICLLLFTFFILGTPQVIRKYYNQYKTKNEDGKFIAIYFFFLVITSTVASLLYLMSKGLLVYFYQDKSPLFLEYINVPLYCILVYAVFHFFNAISNVKLRIVVPAIFYQLLNRILGIFLIFLYAYYHIINLKEFTLLYTVSFFGLPAIGLMIYILYFLKPKFSTFQLSDIVKVFRTTSRYNFFLIFSVASVYIIQAIDAQMIGSKLGLEEVGIYSIAFYIGAIIDIPQRALSSISFPILTKAFDEGRIKDVRNIYYKSSINQYFIGALIFSIVWINLDALFEIIPNGESYKAGKYVVFFIGIGKLFNLLMGVNKQIIEASKYYVYNLLNNVMLSILLVVLNLYFIPLNHPLIGGINGAAFASMLSLIFSNLISYSVLALHYNFKLINKLLVLTLVYTFIVFFVFLYCLKFSNPYSQILVSTTLISIIYFLIGIHLKIIDVSAIKRKFFNF